MSVDTTKALARSTDPVASHAAASAVAVQAIEGRVLRILADVGPMLGNALNAVHLARVERSGWPECHPDSPRKRLHELVADGLVHALRVEKKPAIYSITLIGSDALEAWEAGSK